MLVHRPGVRSDVAAERPSRHAVASTPSGSNGLYLASVGVIATAIAGIFFGAGFLSLAPSAGGTISNPDFRNPALQGRPLLPGFLPSADGSRRPAEGKPGPLAIKTAPSPGAGEMTTLPARPLVPPRMADEAPLASPQDALFDQAQAAGLAAGPPRDTSAQSASAPVPAPDTLAAPALASPNTHLPATEITALLEHGDALLRIGDLASARLFYERAATAGDGRAALRLGATFDPDFLDRASLRNVKGDAATARSWYSRALDLGAAEAKRQLKSLETKQGR